MDTAMMREPPALVVSSCLRWNECPLRRKQQVPLVYIIVTKQAL